MHLVTVIIVIVEATEIKKLLREGMFFLGGEGWEILDFFSEKKCWPSLAF